MRRPAHLQRYECRSLRLFQRSPTARERFSGRFVRIWSQEHGAYWRRSADGRSAGNGYTVSAEDAGVVPISAAIALTCHCGPEKDIWFEFVSARKVAAIVRMEGPGSARAWVVDLARAERDIEIADFIERYADAVDQGLRYGPNPLQHSEEVKGVLVTSYRGLASSIRAGLVEGGEMLEAAE